jgi:hypothetical protein
LKGLSGTNTGLFSPLRMKSFNNIEPWNLGPLLALFVMILFFKKSSKFN